MFSTVVLFCNRRCCTNKITPMRTFHRRHFLSFPYWTLLVLFHSYGGCIHTYGIPTHIESNSDTIYDARIVFVLRKKILFHGFGACFIFLGAITSVSPALIHGQSKATSRWQVVLLSHLYVE